MTGAGSKSCLCTRFAAIGIIMGVLVATTIVRAIEPESEQHLPNSEVVETLYLYSVEPSLGGEQKKVIEAPIAIGKAYPFKIEVDPGIGLDLEKWNYYAVRQPFDLLPPPESKTYKEVVFTVNLLNPELTAFDLFPRDVTVERQSNLDFGVTPKLRFGWAELEGKIAYSLPIRAPVPVITAYGVGQSRFKWNYTGIREQPLTLGAKDTYVLLEVPKATHKVNAVISYEATFDEKRYMALIQKVSSKTDTYTVEWPLH
jgi:hypothetical protein